MPLFSVRDALWALAAFGLLVLAPGAQAQRPGESAVGAVDGIVTAVSPAVGTTASARLTITTSRNVSVTLALTSSTRLIVDGRPAPSNFDLTILKTARAAAIYKPGVNGAANTAIQIQSSIPRVEGTVSPLTTKTTLVITTAAGATVKLGVTSATHFVVDGKPLSVPPELTTLIGDRAAASYNGTTGVALTVEAVTPRIEGTITEASATSATIQPERGTAVTLVVANSTTVLVNGATGKMSAALKNAHAAATYHVTTSGNVTVRIEVRTPSVEGTITEVSVTSTAKMITIKPERGQAVTLLLAGTTQLIVNGVPPPPTFDLTTLKGGRVFATYTSATGNGTTMNTAILVRAISKAPSHVEGTLSPVTSAATTLTIIPRNGPAVVLTLNANSQLHLNGRPATLADLAALTTTARAVAVYVSGSPNVALSVNVFAQ